jgi:protein-tyrosine-phosphatase
MQHPYLLPMTISRQASVIPQQLNVLFICSGNSGRSIMGESILRRLGLGKFKTFSAGKLPIGRINPMTIKNFNVVGIRLTVSAANRG